MLPAFIIDELNRQQQIIEEHPLSITIDNPDIDRNREKNPCDSEPPRGVVEINFCL
jgi:hypothetical protein